MSDFVQRFQSSGADANPQGLQLLFFVPPQLEAEAVAGMLNALPGIVGARCELVRVAEVPAAASLVSDSGPPASVLGLIQWESHTIRLAQFDAPMPYGPVESCVGPALIPPPMKVDATQHQSHILLYYAGTHPDTLERFAALCAVAGALARCDAIVVLNEEARTAAPAFDLVPEPGEDAMATYRGLPIPYLLGGFVKMDTGQPDRPWIRTFANHRLGLPNLARQVDHEQTAETFQLFAGMLGYLRTMQETFTAGDDIDLGDGGRFHLREPHESEWFLESEGPMLVLVEAD
jgi:hypothetical protein